MPQSSSPAPEPAGPEHPPRRHTRAGEIRRLGVEIEFGGLGLEDAAEAVRRLLGGDVRREAPFRYVVAETRLGDFEVELDTQYAQPGGLGGGLGAVGDKLAEIIGHASQVVVPSEVTCPPIPYVRLPEIAALVEALARAGAEGTEEALLYAFGLQLNPEAASTEAADITRVLKAYLLLSDWLRAEIRVDSLREILPFADPFPLIYRAMVADPEYRPGRARLIGDYLADNPTRNRELDMLPLFAHLDRDRVARALVDPRIKPRPAYHYRLPNSSFARGGAHLFREWSRWVTVERLAEDGELLDAMGADFLREVRRGFDPARWVTHCRHWLKQGG